MYLSLRSLQGGAELVNSQYDASLCEGAGGDAFRVVSPVVLMFDIAQQDTGRYRVVGKVAGELELTCGRCLEPITLPVVSSFDLCYVPRTENIGEGEREVEEDDLTTAFYADDQIDLRELITEQLQLALPMKPLCSAACRGLCPQCGTNWNTASCRCSQQWEDPRLAALKQFKR